ncbi:MAG: hypothetical protein A2Z83_00705 [Omnitrophica bacterium GWA2_52_8]|nr:MAG: hypothetical protein A2Z83_00705 [Omnitrophica bacterium GWA2_52_8]
MKPAVRVMCLCGFFCAFFLPSDSIYAGSNPLIKLGNGIEQIVFSPIELLLQPARVRESETSFSAYTGGILQGIVVGGSRILAGVYDILTFPFPVPAEYETIHPAGTPLEAWNASFGRASSNPSN